MRLRKSKWLIVLTITVAVIIGLIISGAPAPEPVYNGKSLSRWLMDYEYGDQVPEKKPQAEAAVRAIGQASIPHLTRWIAYRPRKAWPLEEHYPVRLRRLLNIPTEKGDELYVNQLVSIYGFKILGAEAASAVPDLMKTLRAGEVESSAFAAEALTYIGEPAAPSLSTLLTDPDFAVRKAATNAMNAIADRAIGKIPIPE